MMRFSPLMLIPILWSFGCATVTPPVAGDTREQERMLTDAAARIAESLAKLALVEQSARHLHVQAMTPADTPTELQARVAVDYQGDLKPLVHRLAAAAGYQVKTYGRATVLTPVAIHAEDRSIGELLADIGYQANWRCDVVVVASQRVVEIRYGREHPPSPLPERRAS